MDIRVVLFVLYTKDKRQIQDNQDEEVQIKYREQKKFRWTRGFPHPSRSALGPIQIPGIFLGGKAAWVWR
jgi:hypothetical protein